MQRAARHCLSPVLLVALAACGGGGGGGSSSGSTGVDTGTSAPPASATGLVPAAAAVGTTLYVDAGVLRPLQDGGVWKYRGTAVAGPGVAPTAYVTSTSQTSTAAGIATETSTNAANGGSASTALSIAAGTVATSEPIDFAGKGTPEALRLVELRSPVRQGDQMTILDRRYVDTAIDADGDGKADVLDVAIYSQVVGVETVVLPNLPTLQAVRVDTVALSRVTYSSNGKVSPVVRATQQTWYAAGVGIVRQGTSAPTASNNGVATTDELLVSWDGGSSGFGAMDTVPATVPTTSGIFPGKRLPAPSAYELSAFGFGDHVLVVTTTPDITTGTLISSLDLRGRVTATHLFPSVPARRIVRGLRDGMVLIHPSSTAGVDYNMVQVDANGVLVGAVEGAPLRLSGTRIAPQISRLAVAADDSRVWLLWTRSFYDPGTGQRLGELVLQTYSPAGESLGPEQIVDSGNAVDPEISAAGGQALMKWALAQPGFNPAPPYDVFYRSASAAGLGPTQVFARGLNSSPFLTPLRLGTDSALVWKSSIGTNANLGASGGLRLDSTLQTLRAGTSFLDEQIAAFPPFDAVVVASLSGASRLLALATQPGPLWSNSDGSLSQSLGWMDITGTTPLAKLPVQTVRFGYVQPVSVVGLADRALVFGSDYASQLTTTIVWFNAASATR